MNELDQSTTEYRLVWREGYSGPWSAVDAVFDTDRGMAFERLVGLRKIACITNRCYAIAKRKCHPWSVCISTIPTDKKERK